MTIEEKRKAINDFCNSHGNNPESDNACCGCPFEGNMFCDEYSHEFCSEVVLAKWYALFFEKNATEPINVALHSAICDELKSLYYRKNTDYGDSFHKTFIEEGMAMSRIRLTDKLERFKRLTRSGEQNVKDESIRDTLIDLANYAIMTIVEMERETDD